MPRTAARRSPPSSAAALRTIRRSDRNQPSRLELTEQEPEILGGPLGRDLIFRDEDSDDVRESARGLEEIPDAGADVRQTVIGTVLQPENHHLFTEPGRQLIGRGDRGGIERK